MNWWSEINNKAFVTCLFSKIMGLRTHTHTQKKVSNMFTLGKLWGEECLEHNGWRKIYFQKTIPVEWDEQMHFHFAIAFTIAKEFCCNVKST